MALKVKTRHGKKFRRCGMVFDSEWKTVPDRRLKDRFGFPEPTPKSPTVEEVLKTDPMLECRTA